MVRLLCATLCKCSREGCPCDFAKEEAAVCNPAVQTTVLLPRKAAGDSANGRSHTVL